MYHWFILSRQIKALIHRVDDAIALEKEAQSLAEDTEDSIPDLMDLLVQTPDAFSCSSFFSSFLIITLLT